MGQKSRRLVQAHARGCAQLLSVAVDKGASVYYASIFVAKDSTVGVNRCPIIVSPISVVLWDRRASVPVFIL